MNDFTNQLRRGIDLRLERASAMVEQAAAGPTLVRVTIVLAALGGFAVTWPARDLVTAMALLPLVLALLAGAFPRTGLPTVGIVVMIAGYLYNIGTGEPITTWRVIAAAALIYVVHTGAAFAAVLPFNAVATPGLFLPFVLRTVLVIGITAVIAFGVLAVPGVVGDHRLVSAAVAGMVAMVGVAGYVAYLGWRRQ